MAQPKLPPDLQTRLDELGFVTHCYQPPSSFRKGPRSLPNVPNPDDPWEVFLRTRSCYLTGIVAIGYGGTLREAVEAAIQNRPGVAAAVRRLDVAIEGLVEAMRCL